MVRKKRDRTQEQLDRLQEIRRDIQQDKSGALPVLEEALRSASNFVVAKAAAIVSEKALRPLIPHLLEAFHRFLDDSARIDKVCTASTAIAKALYELDHQDADVYRRGIRHKQYEGLGPADVAAELRGVCAMGIAQTQDERAMDELVLLLTDAEAQARLGAARALGCRNDPSVIPVLMLKVHLGDREVEVLAECMASILAVAVNARTLGFVVEQLDSGGNDLAEAAALALGSVRDERAFEALRDKWDSTPFGTMSERILYAMALSRTERAFDHLHGLIANEPLRVASMAVRALAIHRRDERISERMRRHLEERPELASVIRDAFNRSTLE